MTKQLTLENIVFYKAGQIIPHECSSTSLANCVLVTFKAQKNERKFDTVTQYATLHPVLCPVKQWAAIAKFISLYPGASKETPVSAALHHKQIAQITQKMVNEALRDGVKAYRKSKLRIKASEVGTHSLSSGAAMAMYRGGLPVYSIQLIGRWLSNSFMKYIQKQIKEFTLGVSMKMLTVQVFCHIPSITSTSPEETEYGMSDLLMLGGL